MVLATKYDETFSLHRSEASLLKENLGEAMFDVRIPQHVDIAKAAEWSETPRTFEQKYGSMANTFSTTGGTAHSTLVTGLANGQSYSYYVRCQDSAGNANAADLADWIRLQSIERAPCFPLSASTRSSAASSRSSCPR